MEINTIKILLDNYFEGKTDLSEEQKLKTYFNSNNIDTSLIKYKILFEVLEIDGKIYLQNPVKINKKVTRLNKLKIAASIVLFIGISFVSKKEYDNYQMRKQLATIKKTIYKIGSNLNKANIAMVELNKINNVITKK